MYFSECILSRPSFTVKKIKIIVDEFLNFYVNTLSLSKFKLGKMFFTLCFSHRYCITNRAGKKCRETF